MDRPLHGNADRLRDAGRFDHEVIREARAETSTRSHEMDGDIALHESQRASHNTSALRGSLRRRPDFQLAVRGHARAVARPVEKIVCIMGEGIPDEPLLLFV